MQQSPEWFKSTPQYLSMKDHHFTKKQTSETDNEIDIFQNIFNKTLEGIKKGPNEPLNIYRN